MQICATIASSITYQHLFYDKEYSYRLGTCSELTGFIMKGKPSLAVSFLDTVTIFYYIRGLPATEILPYRVHKYLPQRKFI